jgi:hypothetical protein
MNARRLALASVGAALTLTLAGCGSAGSSIVDAAKSQAGSAVAAVQCQAIATAQTKLGDLATADPATLESINSAVDQVATGLSALGDKVPAQVKEQFTEAAGQLDQAIADAEVDPAKAKAALTSAGDKITASLSALSTSAGC